MAEKIVKDSQGLAKELVNDCISRQAAIDAIHEEFDECLGWDEDGRYTANEIERILVCLPSAQPKPHWIPCSERLPEKNCRCLTTNTAWGAFEVDFNVWINGEWLYPNEKPIAWMPLPESYRG